MNKSIEPKFGSWNADILKAAFHSGGAEGPLQVMPAGSFILLVGPRSLNTSMLNAIARLLAPAPEDGTGPAQAGEAAQVRVLDGGNRFNAYTLARLARGRPEVLERITVSRAFTCYQVLSLLESTPASLSPFVVLDLLNTFYDESVQVGERKRLLRLCITQLKRLEAAAGGAVSLHPPAVPSQAAVELLGMLQAATAEAYFIQPAAPPPEPLRLF
jgi:hypothetical protein